MTKYIFTVLCWIIGVVVASAQTVEIPKKIQFAGMELELDESARAVIGQKTKFLTGDFLRYQKYQEHGRMYFPFVEQNFRKNNVPDDFKYLLLLESTYLTHNVLDGLLRPDSDGFWQMRTSDAKQMQMTMNEDIDERNHIILASRALGKFFNENNELLDNWIHTLLTKELGFTQTGEIIDKSLAGKKSMKITKEDHVYILNFLAHYITFKDKITPDPTAVKLIVYQGEIGEKIQETSQKIALTENINDYNLWNINPDEGLTKAYPVILPIMPDEEKKAKTFLGEKIIKREPVNETHDDSETEVEEVVKETKESEKEVVTEEEETPTETKIEPEPEEIEEEIVIQKSGDFPVLKNQKTKKINDKTFVFVEANGISAIIAQAGQNVSDVAKAGNLSEAKFLKYNEITGKDLQVGTVYYLAKKKTKGATKTHLLQESEDLTDVSQIYGVRKSNLLAYNILGENTKFIKYQEIKEEDTEIMDETVAEDDSVFVGGRVLNLQAKLSGKPQFKVLRKIKKAPKPKPKPLVILEATAESPLLSQKTEAKTDSSASEIVEEIPEKSEGNHEKIVAKTDDSEGTKSESDSTKNPIPTWEKRPITSDYYTAIPNDTWSGIAYMFSIKQSDLYLWNGANSEKVLYVNQKVRITQPPAMPKPDVHIVAQGETLSGIAQRYGITQNEIVKRNALVTTKLPAGCKLYLGAPKEPKGWHTVQPKETFFSIARRYDISFRDLLKWNNMTLKSKVYKGSKLALEAGLLGGSKIETSVSETVQKTETTTYQSSSESTISESTAEPVTTERTNMPDIADPASLTMLITKKTEPANPEVKPETGTGDPNIYEVKNDSENIYEIASTFGIATSNLKKWNDLPSGVMDFPKGTKLRITSPEPVEIAVKEEPKKIETVVQETVQKTVVETTPEVEEMPAKTEEKKVVIATDANGNDPASLTASILQDKLDKQRENSEPAKTETETETETASETVTEENNSSSSASKNMDLDISYYHEVSFGETIEGILEQFKITEAQLLQWNPDHQFAIENGFFNGDEKLIIKDPNQ